MVLAAAAYKQVATYWGSPVQDVFGGFTFAAPVTIRCRWEEKIELFTNREGNEQRSHAIVYLLSAVHEGGYLYLGTSVATDPTTLSDARMIQRADSVPDLRGLNQEHKAYL